MNLQSELQILIPLWTPKSFTQNQLTARRKILAVENPFSIWGNAESEVGLRANWRTRSDWCYPFISLISKIDRSFYNWIPAATVRSLPKYR